MGSSRHELEKLLQKKKKSELVELFLYIADSYENVEEYMLMKLKPQKHANSTSKQIMYSYIEREKDCGFIAWNKVDRALQGVSLISDEINLKTVNFQLTEAAELATSLIEVALEILAYTDDSGGEIGFYIEQTLKDFDRICDFTKAHKNEYEKDVILDRLLHLIQSQQLAEWSEWQTALLISSAKLMDSLERKKKIEASFASLERQLVKERGEYGKDQVLEMKLAILEQTADSAEVQAFLEAHINCADFRERLIQNEVASGEYEKALAYLPKKMTPYWLKIALPIYEQMNDSEYQKATIHELIMQNQSGFYEKYKMLFTNEQWPAAKEKLVKQLADKSVVSYAFVEIILLEQLWVYLLRHCQENKSNIVNYYRHLKADFEQEATDLFHNYILEKAEIATNRKAYYSVCKDIKVLKYEGKTEVAEAINQELQNLYPKRSALLDELSRI